MPRAFCLISSIGTYLDPPILQHSNTLFSSIIRGCVHVCPSAIVLLSMVCFKAVWWTQRWFVVAGIAPVQCEMPYTTSLPPFAAHYTVLTCGSFHMKESQTLQCSNLWELFGLLVGRGTTVLHSGSDCTSVSWRWWVIRTTSACVYSTYSYN